MKRWLLAKVHPTWHFTMFCIGVLGGVVCAQWWSHFSSYSWLAIAVVFLLTALYKQWRWCLLLTLVAGICVGLFRGSLNQGDMTYIRALYGTSVELTGKVLDDVDTNSRGRRVVRLGEIQAKNRVIAGKIFVTLKDDVSIQRSDKVTVKGQLSEGFGSFVGTMYDASVERVERPKPGDVALEVRDWFSGYVHLSIHDPAASLGTGYLLGQKQALPHELQEALQITGLTHIVVASGYNLTILVRLARRLFAKVSRYLAVLTSSGLIVGFIGITGFSPSMSRAGLVAFLSLWAWTYGRKFHPITLLCFVGAVTVLIDPSYAWGDIGWQLSFAAFAGVMIVAPLLQRYFFGKSKPSTIRQILGETIAAQIVTVPITIMAFGYVSLISVVANLLIVPFVPLAMLLTFFAGIVASVAPILASVVGIPAQWLLDGMIWIINQCAQIPWAQMEVSMPGWAVVVWYAVIGACCYWLIHATKYNLREASLVD